MFTIYIVSSICISNTRKVIATDHLHILWSFSHHKWCFVTLALAGTNPITDRIFHYVNTLNEINQWVYVFWLIIWLAREISRLSSSLINGKFPSVRNQKSVSLEIFKISANYVNIFAQNIYGNHVSYTHTINAKNKETNIFSSTIISPCW